MIEGNSGNNGWFFLDPCYAYMTGRRQFYSNLLIQHKFKHSNFKCVYHSYGDPPHVCERGQNYLLFVFERKFILKKNNKRRRMTSAQHKK